VTIALVDALGLTTGSSRAEVGRQPVAVRHQRVIQLHERIDARLADLVLHRQHGHARLCDRVDGARMPVICDRTCSGGTVTMLCTSSLDARGTGMITFAIGHVDLRLFSFGVTITANAPASSSTSAISGVTAHAGSGVRCGGDTQR